MIQNNISIKIWLIYISLVLITTSSQIQVPTTFGLITVTHARGGDNSQFMTYLKRYAYMDCPAINQISIIWNNEKSMEDMGIFQDRDKWKIPIYFYRTPYNAMYWRYNLPKQTKSEVLFSIDDDIIISCAELMKGFAVWRKNAIGNLGPMVTYGARFFEYTADKNFIYGRKKEREYFNTGLNIAFVSRHFLELYYADLWELNELKTQILKKNNCDDIALNWIIQYFYPQLPTIVVQGDVQNKSPAVAQSTTSTHYKYRNECLRDFTDIFGLNPLRYIRIKDQHPDRENKFTPLIRDIVLAKQRYLNKYILKKQSDISTGQSTKSSEVELAVFKKDETQSKQQQLADVQKFTYQLRKHYEGVIQSLSIKQQQLLKQLQTLNQNSNQEETIAKLKKQLQAQQSLQKQLIGKNYWRSYFQLLLALLFIYMLWRVCEGSGKKQRKPKHSRLQSNQVQIERQYLKS